MSLQFIKNYMPNWLKNILRPPYGFFLRLWRNMTLNYEKRVKNETSRFDQVEEVNELPPIFHYWSNRYLRPKLEEYGFSHPDGFFAFYAKKALNAQLGIVRSLCIGSCHCDTEDRQANSLDGVAFVVFFIFCMDLCRSMFSRV